MNRWVYIIIFLLASMSAQSWACVEQDIHEDGIDAVYEDDQTFIECGEDFIDYPCSCDPEEEEEHPTPEGTRINKRCYWEQTIHFAGPAVISSYRPSVFVPRQIRFNAEYTTPPKPGYYSFIFRYSPF